MPHNVTQILIYGVILSRMMQTITYTPHFLPHKQVIFTSNTTLKYSTMNGEAIELKPRMIFFAKDKNDEREYGTENITYRF